MVDYKDFLVEKGKEINIKLTKSPIDQDTIWEKEMDRNIKKIKKIQEKLYAQSKFSVLICLQGMDTSGKDSLIRKVFGPLNPAGVKVHSFKAPTKEELNHDYLWRHYKKLPGQGEITVFNRTHYENVLVTKVHPEYILGRDIPQISTLNDINKSFWNSRFEQINQVESIWTENGMIILKFFLNISKEEQKNRLLARLENKEKHWKFDSGDLKERRLWASYQNAYSLMLKKTSTLNSPWYLIPSDSKPFSRFLVSEIVLETLKKFDIKFPKSNANLVNNIESYINELKNT